MTSAALARSEAALYCSVGERLIHYDVHVEDATLLRRGAVALPANVQYAWPHPSRRFFYVASSDVGSARAQVKGKAHHVSAFRIDAATGALEAHGAPQPLAARPIHISLDATGAFALIAYAQPSGVTVHQINEDGMIGAQVAQPDGMDFGFCSHQVLVTPSNRTAILVTRGNDAAGGKAEDPGALKVFDFKDGVLRAHASIAPGKGYGFGPRHLDFHPAQPWAYVSIERQNQLHAYRLEAAGVAAEPAFIVTTLADPRNERPRQLAGPIHMHPNGKFVYVANRADGTVDFEGRQVFGGGENSIAVYAIDQATGEPTAIQRADTSGFHPRTFALDPGARVLVAANKSPLAVRDASTVRDVPASLDVFRIGADGKLARVRSYEIDVGNASMFWMGIT